MSKPSPWNPIVTAPKDGRRFIGRIVLFDPFGRRRTTERVTWRGKASHVPLYGWCHGNVENVDLWSPTHWRELP